MTELTVVPCQLTPTEAGNCGLTKTLQIPFSSVSTEETVPVNLNPAIEEAYAHRLPSLVPCERKQQGTSVGEKNH